jgi:hydroxyacylglutathione hydrolase
MLNLKRFVFNDFQVNCYLVADESKECIIIDVPCYNNGEQETLIDFIQQHELRPKYIVNTHCHVDHLLGAADLCEQLNLPFTIHADGTNLLNRAMEQASLYGFELDRVPAFINYVKHGDIIKVGSTELEVRYTPGHADGSICLVNHEHKIVFSGDVLFRDSVGRTDLPGGSFDVLNKSIQNELFTLDDVYTVYPGHGAETSIGYEKVNNPFL